MCSGVDSQLPSFFSKILGNLENSDHMISDVVDDIEACLQIALFLLCSGGLKVEKSKILPSF